MKLKSLLKPLISLILIALLLTRVDSAKLLKILYAIPISTAIYVVLGYAVGQLLSSYKWCLIARTGGLEVSYAKALRSYFMGMFVNCFGLGLLGGDLMRGLLLSTGSGTKARALASVVADRLHGLAVLAFIGVSTTLLFGSQYLDKQWLYLLVLIWAVIVAGWIGGPQLLVVLTPKRSSLHKTLEQIAQVFPKEPGVVLRISLISAAFHFLQISLHWIMGAGLGVSLPWISLLVVIPFVNIMSSLPISWQGLGVREAGYIFFLTPQLLSNEQAIAFGALWLLAVTCSSAIGGVLAFQSVDFGPQLKSLFKREIQSEKLTDTRETDTRETDARDVDVSATLN